MTEPSSASIRALVWRMAGLGLLCGAFFGAGILCAPMRSEVAAPVCPEPQASVELVSLSAAEDEEAADPSIVATLRDGDEPPPIGQSIGAPRAGALYGGARLLPGDGFLLRNPATTYGTAETVAHLERAIATARTAYPNLHPVLVGDLSAELGGMLLGHRSHQSGRDVDLGMLYRRRPAGFPQRFTDATPDNLHLRGTLALVQALADTADAPGGVEWILLDYGVQKILRGFAERQGMPSEALDRLFQYPHGPTAQRGLLRHFPGHRNHMHVRFACPPGDRYCASPAGPPQVARADPAALEAIAGKEANAAGDAPPRP